MTLNFFWPSPLKVTKKMKVEKGQEKVSDKQTDINRPTHYLLLWSLRGIRKATSWNPIKKVNSGINGMSVKTCLLKHCNCRGTQYSLQNSSENFQRERLCRGMNFNYWCCSITLSNYLAFLNWSTIPGRFPFAWNQIISWAETFLSVFFLIDSVYVCLLFTASFYKHHSKLQYINTQ